MGRSIGLIEDATQAQGEIYVNLDVEKHWCKSLSHMEIEWEQLVSAPRYIGTEHVAVDRAVHYYELTLRNIDGVERFVTVKPFDEILTVVHSDASLVKIGDRVRLGNNRWA